MSAPLFNRSHTQVIGTEGRAAPGAKIYFFNPGTTTPRVVYNDGALTAPRAHPVVAGATGLIPGIYLPYGDFRVRVETSLGVVLSDDDNIANPAPPAVGGGGGGDPVPEVKLLQTGFTFWMPYDGLLTGFVRVNGRSIGSAASGATERANPDTEALYAFLWNNITDTFCPVSGGRGASAAADFAANKAIALPDARGRALWGLDTMGSNAANTAQVTTNLTTTISSTSATVASNAGLAVGMFIAHANVLAGTTITAISGTTVTLSATASASGLASGRFSVFRDAQEPGALGGSQTHAMLEAENATHTHIQDVHGHDYARPLSASARGDSGSLVSVYQQTLDGTGGVSGTAATNQNSGLSRPHNNMPPGITGTYFVKL